MAHFCSICLFYIYYIIYLFTNNHFFSRLWVKRRYGLFFKCSYDRSPRQIVIYFVCIFIIFYYYGHSFLFICLKYFQVNVCIALQPCRERPIADCSKTSQTRHFDMYNITFRLYQHCLEPGQCVTNVVTLSVSHKRCLINLDYLFYFFLCLLQYFRNNITCPERNFYRLQADWTGQCVPCSTCNRGKESAFVCNVTHDTECVGCPENTYNDVRNGQCRPCTLCNPGEYTQRLCKPYRDTICKPCPEGAYSVRGSVRACRYCIVCGWNERISKQCTPSSDSKCEECDEGSYIKRVRCYWAPYFQSTGYMLL